jgi:hypothetical protein
MNELIFIAPILGYCTLAILLVGFVIAWREFGLKEAGILLGMSALACLLALVCMLILAYWMSQLFVGVLQ